MIAFISRSLLPQVMLAGEVQGTFSVRIIDKNRLSAVPSRHHMVHGNGKLDPYLSWHVRPKVSVWIEQ